jgi:hypothetical protein
MTVDSELALVAVRPLVVERPRVCLKLLPGDRVTVAAGTQVAAGDVLVERARGARVLEVPDRRNGPAASAGEPARSPAGQPVEPPAEDAAGPSSVGPAGPSSEGPSGIEVAGTGDRRIAGPPGELLFAYGGLQRYATGPHPDVIVAPGAATVLEVQPGVQLVLELEGCGIRGSAVLGDPGHGRLAILPGDGESRPALDVGLAGAIVVLPGRTDAETLTRARAMGIAGVIVPSLGERDRRDVVASEARQRAGLHRLTPFPILVLDGHVRRAMAGPVRDLLAALEGSQVGLAGSPPLIVTSVPSAALPQPEPDVVRVRGGSAAGHQGRFLGLAGPTRFAAGIVLEAARVALDDGRRVTVPLGDLERYA